MKLRVLPFAFTSGLFLGVPLALVTLWLLYTGTPGTTVSRLGAFLPGFEFSAMGALVGFGWMFLAGMAAGSLTGGLYNVFATPRPVRAPRPEPEERPVVQKEKKPKKEKPARIKAAKPSRPKKNRSPRNAPKRRKTPYPGRVGAWRDHPYGSFGGYSASA